MILSTCIQKTDKYKEGTETVQWSLSASLLKKIEQQAKVLKQKDEIIEEQAEALKQKDEIIEEQAEALKQKDKIIEELAKVTEQQTIHAQELEIKMNELSRQVNSQSNNSHKPPSSDGFRKPKSERESGGKIGAPKGHQANNLHFTDTPDYVETHKMDTCTCCNRSLENVSAEIERRQVYDLPKIKLIVTEHVVEHKTCPGCGMENSTEFPEGVNARTQYGPQIKAFAAYMNVQHFIPLERLQEITEDLFGHGVSEPTILSHLERLSQNSKGVEDEVREDLLNSQCIHADESGVRVAGKQHWIHTASTAESTVYSVQEKRGSEGMDKMGILPEYKGTVTHDCFKAYFKEDYGFDHALCGAHLIRECQGIIENDKQEWARDMKSLLKDVNKEGRQAKEDGRPVTPEKIEELEQKYDGIVQRGREETAPLIEALEQMRTANQAEGKKQRGRKAQPKSVNLLDRFAKHKAAILMSLHRMEVPFDNNQAERDIRMIKVKQKVSGAFRTLNGADVYVRIRGVISTARKRKLGILSTLIDIAKNSFSFRRGETETESDGSGCEAP
jgi:transposase